MLYTNLNCLGQLFNYWLVSRQGNILTSLLKNISDIENYRHMKHLCTYKHLIMQTCFDDINIFDIFLLGHFIWHSNCL